MPKFLRFALYKQSKKQKKSDFTACCTTDSSRSQATKDEPIHKRIKINLPIIRNCFPWRFPALFFSTSFYCKTYPMICFWRTVRIPKVKKICVSFDRFHFVDYANWYTIKFCSWFKWLCLRFRLEISMRFFFFVSFSHRLLSFSSIE